MVLNILTQYPIDVLQANPSKEKVMIVDTRPKLNANANRFGTMHLAMYPCRSCSKRCAVYMAEVGVDLMNLHAARAGHIHVVIPLAWYPCLSSSKHHAVCTEKAGPGIPVYQVVSIMQCVWRRLELI